MKSVPPSIPWEVLYKTGQKHCPPNPLYKPFLNVKSIVKRIVDKVIKKQPQKPVVKETEPPKKPDVVKQPQQPKTQNKPHENGTYHSNGFVCFQIHTNK